jgi:MFS family permease
MWGYPAQRRPAILNTFCRTGIGIVLSGMLIPWLLGAHGWDWRAVWVVLGALGLLAQLLVEPPLRLAEHDPQLRSSAPPARPRLVLQTRCG